jgi:hypothetical protein
MSVGCDFSPPVFLIVFAVDGPDPFLFTRLCLERFSFVFFKGPGTGSQSGRFPRTRAGAAKQKPNRANQSKAQHSTAKPGGSPRPRPEGSTAKQNKTTQILDRPMQTAKKTSLQTSQTDAKHNDRPKGGATM